MKRIAKTTLLVAFIALFAATMGTGCIFDPSGEPIDTEYNCDDGIDDDGDGYIDCDDQDCDNNESCIVELCGNGTVDATNDEECDSGPLCGEDCKCPSNTQPDGQNGCYDPDLCGNGETDPGEMCDDGNTVDDDGCSANCLSDETCGNGYPDPDEICDEGGDTAACDADCSLPSCGDGYVNEQADEECDSAGESASCNSDCTLTECGDGIINITAGEVCDDIGESADCNVNCTSSECGDGVVNATDDEDCDDAGESVNCNADCTLSVCGDNVLNVTDDEACDGGSDCNNTTCLCPENLESDGSGGCTTSATACSDGVDGDDDGLTDCDDPDCYGPSCVEICDDGVDNDGDGDTDCDDTQCGVFIVHVDDFGGGNIYVENNSGSLLFSDTDNSQWNHTVRVDTATPVKRIWVFTGDVSSDSLDNWQFLAWNNNPGYSTPSPAGSGIATLHHSKNSGSSTWTYYELYCPGTMP